MNPTMDGNHIDPMTRAINGASEDARRLLFIMPYGIVRTRHFDEGWETITLIPIMTTLGKSPHVTFLIVMGLHGEVFGLEK